MEFVVNDESVVNDKRFILLSGGMRDSRYRSNPVMLYAHDDRQVIGRWVNLRIDGGKMYHTPEFDEADPAAKLIKGKVERGFLRGASLGLIPLNAEYRQIPGIGEVVCVTEWEWVECSICAIPSNAGALSVHVYDAERKPVDKENLSAYLDNVVQLSVNRTQNNHQYHQIMTIKLTTGICEMLGISANAEADSVEKAIQTLSARADKAEKELAEIKAKQKEAVELEAERLVDAAISSGKITAEKKKQYLSFAIADLAAAKEVLGDMPEKSTFADRIKPVGASAIPADRQNWTARDWMQKDMPGLMKLKADEPEAYNKLFNL